MTGRRRSRPGHASRRAITSASQTASHPRHGTMVFPPPHRQAGADAGRGYPGEQPERRGPIPQAQQVAVQRDRDPPYLPGLPGQARAQPADAVGEDRAGQLDSKRDRLLRPHLLNPVPPPLGVRIPVAG